MKKLYYSKHRVFNTDVHVLKFTPTDFVFEAIQPVKYTKLTDITSGWWEGLGYKKIAGINASFFPITGLNYLYSGVFISDSKPRDEFFEVMYNGSLHVGDFDYQYMMRHWNNIQWAIPLGSMLVFDGQQNLQKADMFTHSHQRHPRTMLGALANGDVAFVVAEGRNTGDAGLTNTEQATFMVDIGCNWAVNCDGGGSSTMELEGKVVNYMSDGTQRGIANALTLWTKEPYEIIREEYSEVSAPYKYGVRLIGEVEIAPNFDLREVACRHCGDVKFPDYRLMTVAQGVRDHYGKMIRLVGYRCPVHNAAIGGDPNSLHMQGLGLDISAWNGDIDPADIDKYILSVFKWVKRVKLYPGSHVHIQTTWMD